MSSTGRKIAIFRFALNWAKIVLFLKQNAFKQNQIILHNMTLPIFEKKSVQGHKNIHLKTQKQRPAKKEWSEEIMVNCDVICGADEILRCAFSRSQGIKNVKGKRHTEFHEYI